MSVYKTLVANKKHLPFMFLESAGIGTSASLLTYLEGQVAAGWADLVVCSSTAKSWICVLQRECNQPWKEDGN